MLLLLQWIHSAAGMSLPADIILLVWIYSFQAVIREGFLTHKLCSSYSFCSSSSCSYSWPRTESNSTTRTTVIESLILTYLFISRGNQGGIPFLAHKLCETCAAWNSPSSSLPPPAVCELLFMYNRSFLFRTTWLPKLGKLSANGGANLCLKVGVGLLKWILLVPRVAE